MTSTFLARSASLFCIGAILYSLLLFAVYLIAPGHLPLLFFSLNHTETSVRACFSHFHLCALRRFITHHQVYGKVTLSTASNADIYDFSVIGRFTTDFFENRALPIRSPPDPDERFQTIAEMRTNIGATYKDKWLIFNMMNVNLTTVERKFEADHYCSFQPLNHFDYSFEYLATIKGSNKTPTRLIFSVQERMSVAPPGVVLLNDIHAKVMTQWTKAACETKDYTNGNYTIECPLLEPQFRVHILGSYRAPSMLQFICTTKDKWSLLNITSSDLMHMGVVVHTNYSLNTASCSTQPVPPDNISGFWVMRHDVWHWSSTYCYYPLLFDGEIKQCLCKWKIMLFGDSHSFKRNRALHNKGVVSNNVKHTRTLVPSDMVEILRRLDAKAINFASVVLVLNVGHWNLAFVDISTYVSTMPEVFDMIRKLKKRDPPPRIIWMESTAMPYDEYHWRWRLNPVIRAMNDWVNHHMRKLGVSIIPAFDISIAMNDETRDGSHYKELYGDAYYSENNGSVSVGGAIDSVLFNLICSFKSTTIQ